MTAIRKTLIEQALQKYGSRYLVCSMVSKRANQFVRHNDSQGVAWAVSRSLNELLEGRIQPQTPGILEKLTVPPSQ